MAAPPTSQERYWAKRVRSKAFRQDLAQLFAAELRALSAVRFKDLVDPAAVRRAIASWDRQLIDAEAVGDVAVAVQRSARKRLVRQRASAAQLLGSAFVARIEALLAAPAQASEDLEASLNRLVQQEFVTSLLTDLVFTSISTFYQRVNPLFGAFAMRTMEEQIKAFIRRVMPMLQQRVTAFALSRDNQRLAQQFGQSIARQILAEPLGHYAAMLSAQQDRQVEALLRVAVASAEIDALGRRVAMALFDDLYAAVRNRKVGDLLRLERHTHALGEQLADAALPLLSRPGVVAFVAAESARAATPDAVAPPKARRAHK